MRLIRLLSVPVLALGLLVTAMADPYDEGRNLYKAGRYQEAVAKFEEATRLEPNNPKPWWQLNFAYNKLSRYADALRAAETAGKLDPTYSFASSPGKYDETVTRLRGKAGGGSRSSRSSRQDRLSRPLRDEPRGSRSDLGPPAGPGGTMSRQLTERGVFVQSGMSVDVERLRAVMRELEPVKVRFLVFGTRAGSSALSREADRVRRYLGIGDGYVIACSRAGVAASSTALNTSTLRELTRQVAPQMEAGDYTGGLERLARGLVATKQRRTQTTHATWIAIIGGVAGIFVVFVVARRIRVSRAMKERRAVLEQRKADVISGMNYLDDAGTAIPAAVAAQVKQARLDAGAKLDEAARMTVRARDEYDLTRAQGLLDGAAADVARGRALTDAALTGKPIPTSGAGQAPPVYPDAAVASTRDTDWEAVPEDQRGACFFCSRPSLLGELRPVTLTLDGREQQVLACSEDYAEIKAGRPPRIRAFERQGRSVPWYADQDYNPYRDYYDRGYDDRSLVRDLVMMNMIDSMFWSWHRPAWGWGWGGGYGSGWGGYTFWPDHHYYHDYYVERAAGSGFTDDLGRDAAGTDFLDSGPGGSDSDAAGGTDFLGGDQS